MGNLLDPVKRPDVVESVDAGRQTAVQTEDLVVDQGSQRQVVEQICEELPDVGISVLAKTLIIEAVYLCDLSGFVVAAQDGDSGRVSDLQGNKEGDGLDRVVPSVNIVSCCLSAHVG